MASENETVEAAIAAVRKMIHECPAIKGGIGEYRYQLKANGAIDRIEAAHSREVAELRECLREAIDMMCENNGTCSDCPIFGEQHGDCNIYRWRKALEGANDGQDD